MEDIYKKLLNAAILPICCGIPTIGVDNSMPDDRGVIPTFNAGVQALATKYDLPYYDFFPLTDDGDGWKAGWCGNPGAGDNHPSPTAAKAMGQALRDLLNPYAVSFSAANLVTDTTDTASDLLWQNGSMVDDGDADGKPDGGYTQSQTGWYWPLHAQTVLSLEAEPGIVSGNWFKFSRPTLKTQEEYVTEPSINTHVIAGMRIGLGFICKVLNAETTATFYFALWDQSGNTLLGLYVYPTLGDTNVFKLYWDLIIPVGVTGVRARLNSNIAGLHDSYFGQYTIRQL
jgi:hypothetical protein